MPLGDGKVVIQTVHAFANGAIEDIAANLLNAIYRATDKDYQHVIEEAQQAFSTWRNVPAPKRGEVIRAIGDALRQQKDLLGNPPTKTGIIQFGFSSYF